MADFDKPVASQQEITSSVDTISSQTQSITETPEDFLTKVDQNSEFYQNAVENYDDLSNNNEQRKAVETRKTSQKIEGIKNEIEKEIFLEKLGEYKSVLPTDKLFNIFTENPELKEQFLITLEYWNKEEVLSYLERRFKRPSRVKNDSVVKMVDNFKDDLTQGLVNKFQIQINNIKSVEDIDMLKIELKQLPDNMKLLAKTELIELKKNLESKSNEIGNKSNEIGNKSNENKENNETQSLLELKIAYRWIDFSNYTNEKYKDIVDAIKTYRELEKIDITNLKALSDVLLIPENQKLFKELLIDLAETDTETYQRVYTALKEIPAFETFLQNLPTPTHPEPFKSKVDGFDNKSTDLLIAESLVWEDIEKTGDKIYDEDRVIDLAEFPPKYYIVTENGFRLETTVEFGPEITDARTEYMEQKTLLQTEYDEVESKYDFAKQKLDTLHSNLEYAESLEWEDTSEIKKQIKNIELELKNLTDQKDNIKDRFQELEDHFKPYLSHLLEQYKTKLEEKEAKARKVKEFIWRIWLDLLPQSTINQIFSEMKMGSLVVNGIWSFDPKKIDLANGNFDEVVLATGITPRTPKIEGVNHEKVLSYIDVVKHKKPVGKRVAVIGGGAIGFDISEYLAHEGESTSQNIDAWLKEWGIDKTLEARAGIENMKADIHPSPREIFMFKRSKGKFGAKLGKTTGWIHRSVLKRKKVNFISEVQYTKIDDEGVHYVQNEEHKILAVDNIVLCAGQVPFKELLAPLEAKGIKTHVIGGADFAAELDAKRAISQGSRLAAQI